MASRNDMVHLQKKLAINKLHTRILPQTHYRSEAPGPLSFFGARRLVILSAAKNLAWCTEPRDSSLAQNDRNHHVILRHCHPERSEGSASSSPLLRSAVRNVSQRSSRFCGRGFF